MTDKNTIQSVYKRWYNNTFFQHIIEINKFLNPSIGNPMVKTPNLKKFF